MITLSLDSELNNRYCSKSQYTNFLLDISERKVNLTIKAKKGAFISQGETYILELKNSQHSLVCTNVEHKDDCYYYTLVDTKSVLTKYKTLVDNIKTNYLLFS